MGSALNLGQTGVKVSLEYPIRVSQNHPRTEPAFILWGAVAERQAMPRFVRRGVDLQNFRSSGVADPGKIPRY
jgi:hypothetical protein